MKVMCEAGDMMEADSVPGLAAVARVRTTPCGNGRLTWRIWGEGSPIVLIHGSAGSWTHWVRNIGALAAKHTVYVPDLPGFGDSDALPQPHTFAHVAGTLWRGLDALCPSQPVVALVGFSFGSVVAECMALERASQTGHLILLRGSFDDKTPRAPALMKWKHLTDPAELASVHRHNLEVMMFHDPVKVDTQAVELQGENTRRAVADPVAFFSSRPAGALTRITAPVCGIAGQFDCMGLPDVARQGEALLRTRPDARFHLVPNAGHWVAYEAAARVNAILLETLAN